MANTTFSGPVNSTGGFVGPMAAPSTGVVFTNTLTARAGGGQASATALTGAINRVTVAASAADSVKLPAPSYVGQTVVLINSGASSIQVFGTGTDTINGVATATGVAQAAGITALYVAVSTGTAAMWFRNLSA
jgi:hypothetical protein